MANSGNTVNVEITASVEGLKKGLTQAEKGVKTFGTQTDKMTAKTTKMGKAVSGNAVPALTSFSQVIQDAPYGIQGVANNITQLTSQFGYLSKSSGGAMGALKGMLGVLAGPAGILLAVSVITSLWVAYEKEIKAAISGTDEATISTERLNDALRAQVNLRKQLKDELNIATSIAVAKAKLEGKSEADQYAVKKEYADARITVLKGQYDDELKTYRAFASKNQLAIKDGDEELLEIKKQYLKSLTGLQKEIRDSESQSLLDSLNEQVRIQEASKKSAVSNAKATSEEVKQAFQGSFGSLTATGSIFGDVLDKGLTDFTNFAEDIKVPVTNIKETVEGVFVDMSSIIKSGVATFASGIGEMIGALASGEMNMANIGNAMLGMIGDLLVSLGQAAIAAGVAQLAISGALGPWGAIAAGVAAIALGSALSSVASQNESVDTGTDYSSSSTGSSSNYGSSTSNYSSGSSGYGHVVFEIGANKLIGVLKQGLDRNKALGGQNLAF